MVVIVQSRGILSFLLGTYVGIVYIAYYLLKRNRRMILGTFVAIISEIRKPPPSVGIYIENFPNKHYSLLIRNRFFNPGREMFSTSQSNTANHCGARGFILILSLVAAILPNMAAARDRILCK